MVRKHPEREKGAKSRRSGCAVNAVLLCLLIAIAVASGVFLATQALDPQAGRDKDAQAGALPKDYQDRAAARLRSTMGTVTVKASIAAQVQMENGTAPALLLIQNDADWRYPIRVSILLNRNAQTLYTSGIIDPGMHLVQAPLDIPLDPGDHACTATISALDPETDHVVAQVAGSLMIHVAE